MTMVTPPPLDQEEEEMLVPHSDIVEGPQPIEVVAKVEPASTVENQQVEDPPTMKFTWTIENFSRLYAKKHYSDVFVFGGYKWRILLFPKGNNVDQLSMYLDVADSSTLPYGWSRYAQFNLAVVDQIDSKYTIRKDTQHQFNARESDWGFSSFMPLCDLYDPSRGYLVNDTVVIEAEDLASELGPKPIERGLADPAGDVPTSLVEEVAENRAGAEEPGEVNIPPSEEAPAKLPSERCLAPGQEASHNMTDDVQTTNERNALALVPIDDVISDDPHEEEDVGDGLANPPLPPNNEDAAKDPSFEMSAFMPNFEEGHCLENFVESDLSAMHREFYDFTSSFSNRFEAEIKRRMETFECNDRVVRRLLTEKHELYTRLTVSEKNCESIKVRCQAQVVEELAAAKQKADSLTARTVAAVEEEKKKLQKELQITQEQVSLLNKVVKEAEEARAKDGQVTHAVGSYGRGATRSSSAAPCSRRLVLGGAWDNAKIARLKKQHALSLRKSEQEVKVKKFFIEGLRSEMLVLDRQLREVTLRAEDAEKNVEKAVKVAERLKKERDALKSEVLQLRQTSAPSPMIVLSSNPPPSLDQGGHSVASSSSPTLDSPL